MALDAFWRKSEGAGGRNQQPHNKKSQSREMSRSDRTIVPICPKMRLFLKRARELSQSLNANICSCFAQPQYCRFTKVAMIAHIFCQPLLPALAAMPPLRHRRSTAMTLCYFARPRRLYLALGCYSSVDCLKTHRASISETMGRKAATVGVIAIDVLLNRPARFL